METDEELRAAENSDKEVSAAQSQGKPDPAPPEITTMVNYMGAANIETEEGRSISFLRGNGKHIWKESRKFIKHFLIRIFNQLRRKVYKFPTPSV